MLHVGTIVNNFENIEITDAIFDGVNNDTEATETAQQHDQEILKFHEFHKDRSQIMQLRQVKLIQNYWPFMEANMHKKDSKPRFAFLNLGLQSLNLCLQLQT